MAKVKVQRQFTGVIGSTKCQTVLIIVLLCILLYLIQHKSFHSLDQLTVETKVKTYINQVWAFEDNISSAEESIFTSSPNISESHALPNCSDPLLNGQIKILFDAPNQTTIQELYPYLKPGGHNIPSSCRSLQKVAIVVPYRNREEHLRVFLHNIHAFLTKQQLDYAIYVIEPEANQTFNRAKLLNIGFSEALLQYNWDCFIFHDVDLLPENDNNKYLCSDQPRHMSVAMDKYGYKLPYGGYYGGAGSISLENFRKINGLSNDYWGWGGEDDDFFKRVQLAGLKISRSPNNIARYKMIKHGKDKKNEDNPIRHALLKKTQSRWRADGLNSLQYKLLNITILPLFTHIYVDLMEKELRVTEKSG